MGLVIDKKSIIKFLKIIFGDLQENPKEKEYIEVIYDNGDKVYNKAKHFPITIPFEIIADAIILLNKEKRNVSILPNTVYLPDDGLLDKRTGANEAFRATSWIIEIEKTGKEKKQLLIEKKIPFGPEGEVFEEHLEAARKFLPETIQRAIKAIYTTGGGVNLIVKLKEPIEKDFTTFEELHKNFFKELVEKYGSQTFIDISSASIRHAQRVAGTINWKYKNTVRFLNKKTPEDVFYMDFQGYDLSEIKNFNKVKSQEKEKFKKESKESDSEQFILDVLGSVDVPKIFNLEYKDCGYYYKCACPFHPPDKNYSFIVYKNTDGLMQMCYDTHDGTAYSPLELAYKLWNVSSKREALSELARLVGIDENDYIIPKKTKKTKEQKATDVTIVHDEYYDEEDIYFEAKMWLEEAGMVDSNLIITDDEAIVDLFLRRIDGKTTKVSIPYQIFNSPDKFLLLIKARTGRTGLSLPSKPREAKEFTHNIYDFLIRKIYNDQKILEAESKEISIRMALKEILTSTTITENYDEFALNPRLIYYDRANDMYYGHLSGVWQKILMSSKERIKYRDIYSFMTRNGAKLVNKNGIMVFEIPGSLIEIEDIEEKKQLYLQSENNDGTPDTVGLLPDGMTEEDFKEQIAGGNTETIDDDIVGHIENGSDNNTEMKSISDKELRILEDDNDEYSSADGLDIDDIGF